MILFVTDDLMPIHINSGYKAKYTFVFGESGLKSVLPGPMTGDISFKEMNSKLVEFGLEYEDYELSVIDDRKFTKFIMESGFDPKMFGQSCT